MRPEAKKYLFDIRQAARHIEEFASGESYDEYTRNALLRSAVERQFEIIGEALGKLLKLAPDLVAQISDHKQIIAFRNILIHGYADVDHRVVWAVVSSKLPTLLAELRLLLPPDEDTEVDS